MARSRARAYSPVASLIGRASVVSAVDELVAPRWRRRGASISRWNDVDAERRRAAACGGADHDDGEPTQRRARPRTTRNQIAHGAHSVGHVGDVDGSWRAEAPVLAAGPVSFFQIGTVAFSVSMPKRAASNASARWGDDTATTTTASPTPSAPGAVRAARPRPIGPARPGSRPRSPPAGARPAPRRPRSSRAVTPGATLGVVAHRAAEHHDGAAVGPHSQSLTVPIRQRIGR